LTPCIERAQQLRLQRQEEVGVARVGEVGCGREQEEAGRRLVAVVVQEGGEAEFGQRSQLALVQHLAGLGIELMVGGLGVELANDFECATQRRGVEPRGLQRREIAVPSEEAGVVRHAGRDHEGLGGGTFQNLQRCQIRYGLIPCGLHGRIGEFEPHAAVGPIATSLGGQRVVREDAVLAIERLIARAVEPG